jgi:diguanylate cyclase (GGDEF)-like protein
MRQRLPLSIAAVAALYFLVAEFNKHVAVLPGGTSMLWAPAGVGVAAVVLLGRRIWPAIAVGQLANAVAMSNEQRPLVLAAHAVAQVVVALAAGEILNRAHFNPQLRRIRDVLWLMLPAAFLPALLGGLISAFTVTLSSSTPWSSFLAEWRQVGLGDATGIIVLAPLLLTAASYKPSRPHGLRAVELATFLACICGLVALTHFVPGEVAIALPPLLIWSALRFGPPGAAFTTALMAGTGVAVAHHMSGQWHWLSPVDRLLVTQDVFSIGSLATLVLAATLEERRSLLNGHAALGAFATAVANSERPEDLRERVSFEGEALFGTAVAVIEGAETPADPVHAEIDVAGERWGWITLPGLSGADVRQRFLDLDTVLPRLASLFGVGIANARARESLVDLARTDPLTGLANHRVFHERLTDEMTRARRYGRPVAIAMIDVDHFKVINDSVGHVGGDKVLTTLAERVASVMRNDSVVARLGGDEIAVILPESGAHGAMIALQRARIAVSGSPVRPAGTVTFSGGICDSTHADTPERIMELADDALYWSKLHGRDTTTAYSPDLIKPMTEDERKHRLTRTRAVVGLKALAGMIDARSPGYEQHSERVSLMASKLARAAGWQTEPAEALREAAAVHDVGKLTLDQELINKPAERTRLEEQLWRQHPALGAQMTADVFDPDRANWIRWHHERADGRGYPDRLSAENLPEGAALLALADGWDRLICGAPGQPMHSVDEALEICESEAGSRFTHEAVAALRGALAADAAEAAELEAQASPVYDLYPELEPAAQAESVSQGDSTVPAAGDS